ncbi:MAG: methyltransferase domain-containing protein [Desulfuromonadaceae bacterium]|nr:methyltransferase domain-containing protein [Desulfuromonadaceae bacterium]
MPDTSKIAAAFHKNAIVYDQHVLVQKRIVELLAKSVGSQQNQAYERILDVGTGTGALLEKLHSLYPAACLTGVDIALNMCLQAMQKLGTICQVVNGDAEHLPFGTGVFDLVVSASALQWVGDLPAALREICRVVRPGGGVSLAFFCEGSLYELQDCFRDAARGSSSDSSQRISRLHRFRGVDDVKSMLNGMDFEQCVVTVGSEVDWYDDLNSLLRSIKNIGAGTASGGPGRHFGLGWRGVLDQTSRLYRERYEKNGRIPATYKVLYISARTSLQPQGD